MIRVSLLSVGLFYYQFAFSQPQSRLMFQAVGKRPVYYIDVTPRAAYVFQMGVYYGKEGAVAPSIRKIDTLYWRLDNSYSNNTVMLTRHDKANVLILKKGGKKDIQLDTAKNLNAVFAELNEG